MTGGSEVVPIVYWHSHLTHFLFRAKGRKTEINFFWQFQQIWLSFKCKYLLTSCNFYLTDTKGEFQKTFASSHPIQILFCTRKDLKDISHKRCMRREGWISQSLTTWRCSRDPSAEGQSGPRLLSILLKSKGILVKRSLFWSSTFFSKNGADTVRHVLINSVCQMMYLVDLKVVLFDEKADV